MVGPRSAARRGASLTADRARAARVGAVAVTGQWASTVPVDADGHAHRAVHHLAGHDAAVATSAPASAVASRATRPATSLRWVRRTGGAPSLSGADPIGHILALPSRAARARPRRTRWYLEPVDYLTMRFCGEATASHASMQGAWLTDIRHLDRAAPTTSELLDAVGLAGDKLAPLRPIGSIIGHGATPTSRPRSASARRRRGRDGAARPPGRRARRGRDLAVRDAPRAVDDVVDQLPGPEEEDRRLPLDRDGAGARPTTATSSSTTRTPARRRSSGSAACSPAAAPPLAYDELTALAATVPPGARRRAVHAVARRRALPGRRPPRAGRLHERRADDGHRRPRPRGPRGRRGEQPLALRLRREVLRRARSRRSGSSAAARSRRCGARSSPTRSTGPVEQVPEPDVRPAAGHGRRGVGRARREDARGRRGGAAAWARSSSPTPSASRRWRP